MKGKGSKMIKVRRAEDRGSADWGWLRTFHTFSFSSYQDPNHVRFRTLRVMNEDFVAPGEGFGTHPHNDMEIVTYVLQGALEHRDSMGNGEVLRPGEFQRMSAGTGITHSEFNPSKTEPTHLYQIWLFPERKGITPSYEQKAFEQSGRANQFQLVASRHGDAGSLTIHTDAKIYLADLARESQIEIDLNPTRHAWLQVLRGSIELQGSGTESANLKASDGVAISAESKLTLRSSNGAELMLFDLA